MTDSIDKGTLRHLRSYKSERLDKLIYQALSDDNDIRGKQVYLEMALQASQEICLIDTILA